MQDRRRRKKRKRRRSGGQGWKEWERQTVPSWLGSKNNAWWFERSQETVGKKESNTQREERRKGQTGKQESIKISEKVGEEGELGRYINAKHH